LLIWTQAQTHRLVWIGFLLMIKYYINILLKLKSFKVNFHDPILGTLFSLKWIIYIYNRRLYFFACHLNFFLEVTSFWIKAIITWLFNISQDFTWKVKTSFTSKEIFKKEIIAFKSNTNPLCPKLPFSPY
jgi:hypothetical protein